MDLEVRQYRERKKRKEYKERWHMNKDEVMKDTKRFGYNPIDVLNEALK